MWRCASGVGFPRDKRKCHGFVLASEGHEQQLSLIWLLLSPMGDTATLAQWAARRRGEGDCEKGDNRAGSYCRTHE